MDWPFGERDFECFGGPMDGKTMPMPVIPDCAPPGVNSFVVHVDQDGIPHFYIRDMRVDTDTLDTEEVLKYAGTTPDHALAAIREIDPDVAERIENDLNRFLNGDIPDDLEEFDEHSED